MQLLEYMVFPSALICYRVLRDVFYYKTDRLSEQQKTVLSLLGVFLGVAAAPCIEWHMIGAPIHMYTVCLGFLLAWEPITTDFNLTMERRNTFDRLLLLVSTLLLIWTPCVLPIYFSILWLRMRFNTHHREMSSRMLLMCFALTVVAPFLPVGIAGLVLILCVQASHYFVPGFGKSRLGDHWYSWIVHNRTECLVAGAYSWGWIRRESIALAIIRSIRALRIPINTYIFFIQISAPLLLISPSLCIVLLSAYAAANTMIFLMTGLFFWETIAANLLSVWIVLHLPPTIAELLFTPHSALIFTVILMLGPCMKRFWNPMVLAWWDSPVYGKINFEVIGNSGKRYGLYVDMMRPFDAEFSRLYGRELLPENFISHHLGMTFTQSIRDRLFASGGDPAVINKIKEEEGQSLLNEEKKHQILSDLRMIFSKLNRGIAKELFGRFSRMLRAPVGYWYRGSCKPAYEAQEPAAVIEVHYREELFWDDRFITLRDQLVERIAL